MKKNNEVMHEFIKNVHHLKNIDYEEFIKIKYLIKGIVYEKNKLSLNER